MSEPVSDLRPLVFPVVQNASTVRSVPNNFLNRGHNQDLAVPQGDFAAVNRGAGCGTIPFAGSAMVQSACTSGISAPAFFGHLFGPMPPASRRFSRSGILSTELTLALVLGAIMPQNPRCIFCARVKRREYIMPRFAKVLVSRSYRRVRASHGRTRSDDSSPHNAIEPEFADVVRSRNSATIPECPRRSRPRRRARHPTGFQAHQIAG
jgi:hypothetical protein